MRSDRQDQELPELCCPNVLPEPKETKRECEKRKRKAKERVVRLEYRGKPVLTRNRRDSSGFGGFMVYTYVLPLSDTRRPSLPWIWTCRHPRHSGSGGGSRTRFASSVCLRGTCSFSAPGPNPTWHPPSPVRGQFLRYVHPIDHHITSVVRIRSSHRCCSRMWLRTMHYGRHPDACPPTGSPCASCIALRGSCSVAPCPATQSFCVCIHVTIYPQWRWETCLGVWRLIRLILFPLAGV